MKIKQRIICSSCVADVNHVDVNVWSVLMNNTHFDIMETDVDFVYSQTIVVTEAEREMMFACRTGDHVLLWQ